MIKKTITLEPGETIIVQSSSHWLAQFIEILQKDRESMTGRERTAMIALSILPTEETPQDAVKEANAIRNSKENKITTAYFRVWLAKYLAKMLAEEMIIYSKLKAQEEKNRIVKILEG